MTKDLKILFMDLENFQRPEHIFHPGKQGKFGRQAGFCADLAYVLVFGYKWLGEKAKSITLNRKEFKNDPFDDTSLLVQAYEVMNEADVVITWYGSGHDLPFLNTRLTRIGLSLDPKIRHIDLYRVASSKLRLSSNRLDKAAEFFGLDRKMKVPYTLWTDCWQGKYKSLEQMAEYCRQDCEVLANVYSRMLPLVTTLPNRAKHAGNERLCPSCGEFGLISNGYRVTSLRRYKRMRCSKCGSSCVGEAINE